ncbi:MAG TPA: COX15/CtaA family protein, partial [Xanthobacteraceae bacterium]
MLSAHRRAIRLWLYCVAALLVLMVMVGGITRLTDSGLSIVEWRPVTGVVPPLSEEAWRAELDKYKTSSEYELVNKGMTLDEFKRIYWWEWVHRLLGRMIGAAFLLPLLFFQLRGWVEPGLRARLWFIFALGALQGALGWWMVASGLVGRVDVAQERLAIHLTTACVILIAVLWTARSLLIPPPCRQGYRIWSISGRRLSPIGLSVWLLGPGSSLARRAGLARPGHETPPVPAECSEGVFARTEREPGPRGRVLNPGPICDGPALTRGGRPRLTLTAVAILGLLVVQIALGGLVAGLKAGLVYDTWPLIDGAFIPSRTHLFMLHPVWMNFLDNHLAVQFAHRMGAYLLVGVAAIHALDCTHHERGRAGAIALLGVLLVQAALGILTLLWHV